MTVQANCPKCRGQDLHTLGYRNNSAVEKTVRGVSPCRLVSVTYQRRCNGCGHVFTHTQAY